MSVQAIGASSNTYTAQPQQKPIAQPQNPTQATDTNQVQQQATPEAAVQAYNSQSPDQVKISSSITVKNLDTVKAIEQMHATMNQQVKAVRETNETLNIAVEQLNAMQSAVTTILKNFPPFSMDSKDRQELLMSYTAIRQEMMRMTVPQPPPPLYEQVKSLWNKTLGQNGQMLASAVPALDTSSSDSQVKDTSTQLEKTGSSLADLSSGVTKALIGG